MKKDYGNIPLKLKTKKELDKRKAKCAWKTSNPQLTWDEFLLKMTRRWSDDN